MRPLCGAIALHPHYLTSSVDFFCIKQNNIYDPWLVLIVIVPTTTKRLKIRCLFLSCLALHSVRVTAAVKDTAFRICVVQAFHSRKGCCNPTEQLVGGKRRRGEVESGSGRTKDVERKDKEKGGSSNPTLFRESKSFTECITLTRVCK